MRSRGKTPLRATICAVAPMMLAACVRMTADYHVGLSAEHPGEIAVTLTIDGVPSEGLALRAYSTRQALRLSDLQVSAATGDARVEVAPGVEAVNQGGRVLEIPRFEMRGPLPRRLTVTYRVAPGAREGNEHTGLTGRSHGFIGERFAFSTGRNLFLLPQPVEKIGSLVVRFDLPDGWKAVTPWPGDGAGHLRPGIAGGGQAEHLVAGAIGLGRFEEHRFDARGTRHRVAFEAGIPAAERDEALARFRAAATYLGDLFDRPLPAGYLTVVLPRAPSGDDILGEAWADSQGGTLSPATSSRVHEFALGLIDAYLRHDPSRPVIREPSEFWVIDGIRGLYSWKAVVRAGLLSDEAATRGLLDGYVSALGVHGLNADLEMLYRSNGSQRLTRDSVAPFVLSFLDAKLREKEPTEGGFDPLIPLIFRGRSAASLWSVVPEIEPGFRRTFRARFVRGVERLPVEDLARLEPVTSEPKPPAGPVTRSLMIVYTGDTHGYLENCGCKSNQSGGVARRATAIERLRAGHPDLLLLDAGDTFPQAKNGGRLDPLAREEQRFYLASMDLMGYGAAAIGATELSYGLPVFGELSKGLRTPFLSANVRRAEAPIAPGDRLLRAGGLRVAVIGVYEPPRGRAATPALEDHSRDLTIDDPIEVLRRRVSELRRASDLVVALGRLTPYTIRRVARACPDLDLIISSESRAPTIVDHEGRPGLHRDDSQGFLGRTVVAYAYQANYGLNSVRLDLDREGRVAGAGFEEHWLYDDVPDQPLVRDRLNRFYDRVGRLAASSGSVSPPFAGDEERHAGRYVGAEACKDCHRSEYAQWRRTPHAFAFKTLLDRHRHFQPRCVSCHVVGFGAPQGYHLGAPKETLANVQCEVCHGPGGRHVDQADAASIRRQVPEGVCIECHNAEHSDHFVYAERIERVRHDYYEGVAAAVPAASAGRR